MAKAINKVARVIGAVASVVATVAAFIPGGQVIAGIAAAVAAVAGTVASITAQKPKRRGSETSFVFDPNGPIPYAMGRTFVGGRAVHRDTWGKDNEYQGFVSVLSGGGPVHSLDAFIIDNAAASISSGAVTGRYNDFMWDTTQLGNTPEPSFLAPHPSVGSMPGWGATEKLSGYAADLWVLRFDKKGKKFAGGTPRRGWVGRWVKVYDPRQDSTYPGGSGSQRWDDEGTWGYSNNPWLHELAWEIGRRAADAAGNVGAAFSNSLLYLGAGFAISQIDLPSYVYAANVADANSWTISGVVLSSEKKWTVSKTIAQAGGGEPIKLGGKISAFVNAARVSSETIDSDQLIGPCSVPSGAPYQSRINRLIPEYISESHGWEMVPANPVGIESLRTQDGGWRTEGQPYRLVDNVNQAAQLAVYQIMEARERSGIVLALKPHWKGYGPGSCLTLNIPEYGLYNQKAIVIDRQEDPANRSVILTFRTENDAKHALALGTTGQGPPVVDLTPTDDEDVPAPISGAWTVTGGSTQEGDVSIPTLFISGAVDNPQADQVIFEYREAGEADWTVAGVDFATAEKRDILSVKPNQQYDVAISYVVRGVVGTRRIFTGQVTGNQTIAFEQIVGATVQEILDDLQGAIDTANAKGRLFIQSTAPAISASNVGDTWLNDDGKFFDRVDHQLHLNGDRIILNGDTLNIYWTLAAEQPLASVIGVADQAFIDAALANAKIEAIASDSILSRDEKLQLAREVVAINENHSALDQKGATLGNVEAERTAAQSDIDALDSYLGGLSPSWNDVTQDTPIDRDTFNQRFDDVAATVAALQAAIQGQQGPAGINGNFVDHKFIASGPEPSAPSGADPAGWTDQPPETDLQIWYTTATKSFAGALLTAWSVPRRWGSKQNPRGSWNSGTAYFPNDTVQYQGGTYGSLTENTNSPPSGTDQDNADWFVVAAPGSTGAPATPPSGFNQTIEITGGTGLVNLRTLADDAGYTGQGDATITFNLAAALTRTGGANGGIAIKTGSWPSSQHSIALSLTVSGDIYGGGGRGGNGETGSNGGSNGGVGGDAVYCDEDIAITVNSGGSIRAGGGGGGGGRGGDVNTGTPTEPEFEFSAGGGGGGGAPNGVGGNPGTSDVGNQPQPGQPGTPAGGGNGGQFGGGNSGSGGAGGNFASAGTSPTDGTIAGSAGFAIRKNGFTVPVTNNGTIEGSQT